MSDSDREFKVARWRGLLWCIFRRTVFMTVVIASGIHPATASYFMYKKPPRLPYPMTPELLARSPRRSRPFEYRKKAYTPRTVFKEQSYSKNLPPLDIRGRPETELETLRDEFLSDFATSIRREFSRPREVDDGIASFHGSTIPLPLPGKASIVHNPNLGGFKGPLRIAVARGAFLVSTSEGNRMCETFSGALNRFTGIDVRSEAPVSLARGEFPDLNVLCVIAAREFGLSDIERNNLARYLWNGGFAIIDIASGKGNSGRTVDEIAAKLSGLPGSTVSVLPLDRDHPLFHAFFDLSMQDDISKHTDSICGVWFDRRLAAVCFIGRQSFFRNRSSEDEESLQLGVNTVIYGLTLPENTAGTPGPR